MTTLMIDDELGRQASRAAAERGKSLDEFVSEVLTQAVGAHSVCRKTRNGLPVIQVSPPTRIDPQVVSRTLAEELS